ncbi:MAG: carbohydrate-binding family 9-like protein [Paludibacter sp.]|nr:carbohydrate-binding family 9-like protein [Paludibacter sp.]
MKSLKINYLSALDNATAEMAVGILNILNPEKVDAVNWLEQYGVKPDCGFQIARSNDAIFIYFEVTEENIRAQFANDHDPVWQDSCVEFFCKLAERKAYMNFEFNCIGTCLATSRISRNENITPFTAEEMNKIDRYASLGRKTFTEKEGKSEWQLTVKIPFTVLGIDINNFPDKLAANFYKCADGSSKPHYLSWNAINTKNPDFHCPEYFGELIF